MLLRARRSHPAATLSFGLFALLVLLSVAAVLYSPWSGYVQQNVLQYHPPCSSDPNTLIYLRPSEHINRAPRLITLQWDVTKATQAPDGVNKPVYLINGQFPGPTIECRNGDTLEIQVHNLLPDNETLSIHWHGLHMRGANRMDGAVGITQMGIRAGASFTYRFHIALEQSGTFWYHSHSAIQRADGLFGGLVVHDAVSPSGKEQQNLHDALLMVGDWYHRSAADVQASYVTHRSWGLEPVPDSLLLNGRGFFNCSSAIPSQPLECMQQQLPALGMRQGKHRLRVINVGSMAGLTLSTPGMKFTPLAVDGGNSVFAEEKIQSFGILYPGERFDVVLDNFLPNREDMLRIELDDENFTFQNKALQTLQEFPMQDNSHCHPLRKTLEPSSNITYFNLSNARGQLVRTPFPATPQQNVLVYTKIEILQHFANVPKGFLNRTSWAPQVSPPRPLVDLEHSEYDENQLVALIPSTSASNTTSASETYSTPNWVDIIVNNLDDKGHPFHLHGFDFYVLQVWKSPRGGYHAYNPFPSKGSQPEPFDGPYNLRNPIRKDTVFIPRMGYAALRIRADNPGIWFFHCHILWHQGTGMAMALHVVEDPRTQGPEA